MQGTLIWKFLTLKVKNFFYYYCFRSRCSCFISSKYGSTIQSSRFFLLIDTACFLTSTKICFSSAVRKEVSYPSGRSRSSNVIVSILINTQGSLLRACFINSTGLYQNSSCILSPVKSVLNGVRCGIFVAPYLCSLLATCLFCRLQWVHRDWKSEKLCVFVFRTLGSSYL